MNKKDLYPKVISYFQETMPQAQTELQYRSAYELLVAVILSAQCTDKRVNQITPPLFEKYPDVASMAQASPEAIYSFIHSCSYPHNKAKNLYGMALKVMDSFGGEIPHTAEELQSLPGVGRKTANVMLAVMFQQPAMPVDTHVFRVSSRLGLATHATTPLETEKQLTRYIPRRLWSVAHHWLILHGRYVCTARKPHCDTCGLADICLFCQTQSNVKLS